MTVKLLDVNTFAIALVRDHPGHEHVVEELNPGLRGEDTLLVFNYLPLRAHWILTRKWGIDEVDARNSVRSMLEQPIEIIDADRETILRSYDLSTGKNHDVFDCFYLSLAIENEADVLLTTDTDFEDLCEGENITYVNPVPESVLSEFHTMNK